MWEYLYFLHSFVLKDLGSVNGTFLNEEVTSADYIFTILNNRLQSLHLLCFDFGHN